MRLASSEAYPWRKAGIRSKPCGGSRKNKFWRSDLTRKIRVLVAEEDTAFLKMIEDSLVESGYPFRRVRDAVHCDLCRPNGPDCHLIRAFLRSAIQEPKFPHSSIEIH